MYHFCNLQSRVQTHAVLVIALYELLNNPTTQLIEPPEPLLIKWYTLYLKLCRKTRVLHNKLSYMWRLALYPHIEITYMTIISRGGLGHVKGPPKDSKIAAHIVSIFVWGEHTSITPNWPRDVIKLTNNKWHQLKGTAFKYFGACMQRAPKW